MTKCEVCQNEFDLDDLQYVSDAPPLGVYEMPETLMCGGCLKTHLDKKWGDRGNIQVQE